MANKTSRPSRREEMHQRRAEQMRRDKRNSRITWGVVIAILAILVGVVTVAVVKQATGGPAPTPKGEQWTPANVDANGAFHIGIDGGVIPNGTSITKPPTGPRMDMFFDPQCPGCGITDRAISGRVNELLASNELDMYMYPVAFLDRMSSDNYSTRSVNALVTVAEKSPEHFMAFVSALYTKENQPGENSTYRPVTDAKLAQVAVSVGVPQSVADTFAAAHYEDWVKKNTQTQLNRKDFFTSGFSTPSIFFNTIYDGTTATKFTKAALSGNGDALLASFNRAVEEAK